MSKSWWSEGVRFSCIGCGRCCRGEPGAIFFTPEEGERARRFVGMDGEQFRRRCVTLKWGAPSFVERRNGDCCFYDATDAKCVIYPARPLQCSLFPFWPSLMGSKERWETEAKRCPGMNAGRVHNGKEIAALLKQWPYGEL